MKIWISDLWAKGVAKPTKNKKLSPFGNVLQPVGFYDPIFGVIWEVRKFFFENIKIRISDFWAKGVAKSTKNQKVAPFGNVLQPVGFYDPIFGVIWEVRKFFL